MLALISFGRDVGDFPTALEYAELLAGVTPGDPDVIALIENLRRQAKVPDAQSDEACRVLLPFAALHHHGRCSGTTDMSWTRRYGKV